MADAADRLAALLAQEDSDGVVVQALQEAALMTYVRCFASGKRFGLTKERLEQGPEGAEEYHQYLKDMRDKHIAHSVSPFEQTVVGAFLSVDGSKVEGVGQLQMRHIAFDKEGAEQLSRYARLLRDLKPDVDRLVERVQRQASKIPVAELTKNGPVRLFGLGPEKASGPR